MESGVRGFLPVRHKRLRTGRSLRGVLLTEERGSKRSRMGACSGLDHAEGPYLNYDIHAFRLGNDLLHSLIEKHGRYQILQKTLGSIQW
ncbi:MAG: hypothetical protein FRX48_09303 [Lasallia pustulata]|uniref:Uncharacterized protein n=1 Tax=Lasallia pustulata TaxID=136370 RepID=A0A5M8PCQ3_9LECA|nr:MAG: hypothetical protein FRX48_09303 [Lasallia pustulata]